MRFSSAIVILFHVCAAVALAEAPSVDEVRRFDRQIWPVLQKCISCHGADGSKADLNLTDRSSAVDLSVIVPGDAGASSLMHRIESRDPHAAP